MAKIVDNNEIKTGQVNKLIPTKIIFSIYFRLQPKINYIVSQCCFILLYCFVVTLFTYTLRPCSTTTHYFQSPRSFFSMPDPRVILFRLCALSIYFLTVLLVPTCVVLMLLMSITYIMSESTCFTVF